MRMIEKIARAIAEQGALHGTSPSYENLSIYGKKELFDQARAAIEAMREPTQEMRLSGIAEWSRPDPTPEHESTLVFNAVWRAMVDAAIKESDNADD